MRGQRPGKKVHVAVVIPAEMEQRILDGFREGLKPEALDAGLAAQALRELKEKPVAVTLLEAIFSGFVHIRPGRNEVQCVPSFRAVVHLGDVNMRSLQELLAEQRMTDVYNTQGPTTKCPIVAGAPAQHELADILRPEEGAWCQMHDAIAANGATACYHAITDAIEKKIESAP